MRRRRKSCWRNFLAKRDASFTIKEKEGKVLGNSSLTASHGEAALCSKLFPSRRTRATSPYLRRAQMPLKEAGVTASDDRTCYQFCRALSSRCDTRQPHQSLKRSGA
jgi:hypothetical protein